MNYYNRAMLTPEHLAALAAALPADPDRARLLDTLRERAAPLLARAPLIPRVKALLSRNGGVCPEDGAPLRFDPWSAEQHTCSRCGRVFSGERHHRHWARAQHLWLAERMAELSLLAALTEDDAAEARALTLYAAYEELYFELPNRDNVLGPSHLFFSTYLESLWLTSYLAGAFVLRESGRMPEERIEGVNRVADEAAALIGEFNEGLSNRQTWHAAALTAIATWFGDEELAHNTVESRTGLLGHLADGFGNDGVWWEGENYHLFAIRGLIQGLHWAGAIGYDLLEDTGVRDHFRAALLAPARSALPDFTYPARRDSRYGVSLAEPASLEIFEAGRALLPSDPEIDSWLAALYQALPGKSPKLLYDAWLHDAGRQTPERADRGSLSWWALAVMGPPLPAEADPWRPESILLADQGLAILRGDGRYASVECGPHLGGHGHPDSLHLTLFAAGAHWLPDPGTGSYVEPELAWYRSALAHNAPRINGANPGDREAWCEAFDPGADWGWCRARAGKAKRTVVAGPDHLLDVVEVEPGESCWMDLPWHFGGNIVVESPGKWEASDWREPFVTGAERFVPDSTEPMLLRIERPGASLRAWISAPGAQMIRASAPGLPGTGAEQPFLLLRARDTQVRWVTALELSPAGALTALRVSGEAIELHTGEGVIRCQPVAASLSLEAGGTTRTLGGLRSAPARHSPLLENRHAPDAEARAARVADPPELDGTLDGFELGEPMLLEGEHQYRRSEEPYDPERFRAEAWANWDGEAVYLAIAVAKPELILRAPGAAPLELDNEPEDIHSDGVQVYLRAGTETQGIIAVPLADGTMAIRGVTAESDELDATGRWSRTDDGYLMTLRLANPELALQAPGTRIGFELVVNEMQPDRLRRAGQLAWSGGGGWVYLRGDRIHHSELGLLELA
jgi:hypothetical protein